MSAVIVLLIRILLTACLYGFVGWAIYTLWQELRLNSQLLTGPMIPEITITSLNLEDTVSGRFIAPEIHIGRDPDNSLFVSDETVSARHARVSFHHKQWWIEDLQSTNGTFLNDERINTATVIISGDEIRCGRVQFTINYTMK